MAGHASVQGVVQLCRGVFCSAALQLSRQDGGRSRVMNGETARCSVVRHPAAARFAPARVVMDTFSARRSLIPRST